MCLNCLSVNPLAFDSCGTADRPYVLARQEEGREEVTAMR